MELNQMDHDLAIKSQACEKYLLGELPPDLREAYEEHYFSCAECATQLRMAAELVGASQMILRATPNPHYAVTAHPFNVRAMPWLYWLRPALAIPVIAALLFIIGYENMVTIPYLESSRNPNILPMYSLMSGNTRGETPLQFAAHRREPILLAFDVPVDPAFPFYQVSLESPDRHLTHVRTFSYSEAQKTQYLTIAPKDSGGYALIVTGQAASKPSTELARIHFTIAF